MSECGEGRACMGLVDECMGIQQAWTWAGIGIRWAQTQACMGIQQAWVCGDPTGMGVQESSRHGRAGIQWAQMGLCGDPAGMGMWESSRHGC